MGTTISDVALDLGAFALDNEIETGRMIVIHFAPPTELNREHKGPRGRGRANGRTFENLGPSDLFATNSEARRDR